MEALHNQFDYIVLKQIIDKLKERSKNISNTNHMYFLGYMSALCDIVNDVNDIYNQANLVTD